MAECQDDTPPPPPPVNGSQSCTDAHGAWPEFALPLQGVCESGFGMVHSLIRQRVVESQLQAAPAARRAPVVTWPNKGWSLPREGTDDELQTQGRSEWEGCREVTHRCARGVSNWGGEARA